MFPRIATCLLLFAVVTILFLPVAVSACQECIAHGERRLHATLADDDDRSAAVLAALADREPTSRQSQCAHVHRAMSSSQERTESLVSVQVCEHIYSRALSNQTRIFASQTNHVQENLSNLSPCNPNVH